jgi:hypothetical protein
VLAGETEALVASLLDAVKVPELLAVSTVTVVVPLTETLTEVLDKVIVAGAALAFSK